MQIYKIMEHNNTSNKTNTFFSLHNLKTILQKQLKLWEKYQ